ncbi:hypothetical protein [Aureimonas sp. AU4]|uniref:hypothetical protein n=1 Tax=Aureimonas sp. AU4 TaxID=1638163 RepID=UPI0007863BE2|nr:hypothetical protein [Aureimonas sp. AU4]
MEKDAADYAHRLAMIRNFLRDAAAGRDVGRNVSEALYGADRFGRHQLDARDAEDLSYLAVSAAAKACETFPAWVPRPHIRRGFRSFLDWLDVAQLPPAERKARACLDRSQRLRILRNAAHNASLEADIEERATDQWTRIAAEIKRTVGE